MRTLFSELKLYLRIFGTCLLITWLTACQSVVYERIYSEDVFLDKIVNKSLSWPGGYDVRFDSEGNINGRFPAGPVIGRWDWRDAQFCRTISIAGSSRPSECLQIEYSGAQVRFKRSNGGYFLPYRITSSL